MVNLVPGPKTSLFAFPVVTQQETAWHKLITWPTMSSLSWTEQWTEFYHLKVFFSYAQYFSSSHEYRNMISYICLYVAPLAKYVVWFHWLYKPADQQTNLEENFQDMRSFLLFNNSDQDLVGFTGWSGSSSKDILVSILQSTLKETTKSEPKFTQKTSHLTSQHQFLKCVEEFLLIKTPLQQNSTQKTRHLTITLAVIHCHPCFNNPQRQGYFVKAPSSLPEAERKLTWLDIQSGPRTKQQLLRASSSPTASI